MFNTSFSLSVSVADEVSANAELKLKVNITATAVEVFIVEIAKGKSVFEVTLQGIFRTEGIACRHKKETGVRLVWNTYSLTSDSPKIFFISSSMNS